MNQETFMQQLKSSLKGLPAAETDEIVSDYREHFAEGAAAGKSESDIAKSLGNPATIGRSYRVDHALGSGKPGFRRAISALFASISLGLFNAIFVLGPFVGLVGVMVALWAAAIGVGLSGVGVILGVILQPILPPSLSVAGLNVGFLIFASIAASGIGLLSTLGMWQFSKFFAKSTGKYLRFNAQFIRKPKEKIDE